MKRLERQSHRTLTHIECLKTQKCQETEGFKGTEHEGVDVCEDGCVWYQPKKRILTERERIKKRALHVFWIFCFGLAWLLLPLVAVWYIFTGTNLGKVFFWEG